MKCEVAELESWSLLTVPDGLEHSSRILGSSLCSAWHSILLLACFTAWRVKTEGHSRSCRWCCQDSKQQFHWLCKALQETGMKAKRSSLLKTFWFRFLHYVESVSCIWFSSFVLPANRKWKRPVEIVSVFVQSPFKVLIALIFHVIFGL